MRGFHDELGGPESIASPSEWGPVGWGDPMTAAGLPATPATPWLNRIGFPPKTYEGRSSDSPSKVAKVRGDNADAMRRGWLIPSETTSPSADELRHNHLLKRHIFDPGYGVHDTDDWRQMAANGLRVPYVYTAPTVKESRAGRIARLLASPSE